MSSGTPHLDVSTRAVITPILRKTYGKGGMVEGLIDHLADRIDNPEKQPHAGKDRESRIMHICWDWMTGGSTAEAVARQIEAALEARA